MLITLSKLAKKTGVSYTTLQIFADRYCLLTDADIQTVNFNAYFKEKFREFIKTKRNVTEPMRLLGGD